MIDLKSKESIKNHFVKIGYEDNSIFNFDKTLLDFTYDWLKNVHMISNTDDFKIWLFEITDLKTDLMNTIANRLHRKNPFDYNLLIFTTADYSMTVFLHYHKDNDGKIKIRRLKIEKNRLTATDIRILSEIKLTGKEILDDLDIAKIHKDAFDIERVTDKFFEEFKVQIENFTANIKGLESTKDRKNYGLLVVSRLIFLYFVQQKGWLNGVKNYLYDRFQYSLINEKNFFNDILKPLFFECLNTPFESSLLTENNRSKKARSLYENYEPVLEDIEAIKNFQGIPYLNGGLFEPNPKFELNTKIQIDNDLFKDLFENLLNKYNFTVREDLGYDTDIAVDPELLGRIFENMIIEEERSSTGSFYTPRNIINEMCKTSLRKHLEAKFEEELNLKVLYLINNLEDENLYSKQKKVIVDQSNQSTETRDCSIYKLSKNEASKVLQELKMVKICDPAVGSGAFILGMLHILVEIIRKINFHSFNMRINIFDTKREIIQENLYGVDREEGAIDIARLRLWLSLAVEYTANSVEEIRPLPNLSYKIMQGNSLFSSYDGIDFDNEFEKLGFGQVSLFEEKSELHSKIDELIIKRNEFFNATINKKELEKDIVKLERLLLRSFISSEKVIPERLNNREFFSWKINFPEVFERYGFDIVIGNPPYGAEFNEYEKNYLKTKFPNVADYESSQYFYLRGLEILNKNGLISYITTNTFLFNVNADKFRKEIISSSTLDGIYDLTEVSVFKNAQVRTVIKYGLKAIKKSYEIEYFDFNPDYENFHFKNRKPVKDLLKNDKKWLFMMRFSARQEALIENIASKGNPLQKDFYVSQGLIPYDKYRGHSEEIIKNRIWHSDHKKDETFKPELKGGDVKEYVVVWHGKTWISYGDWLGAPREQKYFIGPRVLVREIVNKHTGRLNAGFTDTEYYNTPSIINIISKEDGEIPLFYLLGLLNSRLFALYNIGTSPKAKKGLFPKILVNDVRELPIKKGNKKQLDQMIAAVKTIMDMISEKRSKQNIDNIQSQIDNLTFEIYGINEEDQKTLWSIIS
ncbi:TaqI-like C-terminal specificity domain-containing protein [Neobacillus sp. PS3-34]|uniref:Eco57I restriction-modification methylase domain-containing protein n=1 Tax=Neobacillus sp. PS3-34 TaxID=3070678 RepID=UPI0027E18304|nr:TaqI-like C-terminal specificity domain-containing protein [Neobacillus sp. PS3-34]WML49160.1 TaqI-like C-terminal specificity domain-containing protein [Neobacillus sp. PS3-34]